MAYTSKSAYSALPATPSTNAGKDQWIDNFTRFLVFAGWTRQLVPSYFEIETTIDALSYDFFGCNPANDIFWQVTNNLTGNARIVGDKNPGTHSLAWPFIATGSISPAATHAGVVTAIQQLFPTFTTVPITSTKTRFITDGIFNAQNIVDIGASLRTQASSPQFGGYLVTTASNTKTVLKSGIPTLYGSNNWITVFFAQRVQPFGDIVIAASKGFSAYAPDTPVAPEGPGPLTGFRTEYTGWDNTAQTFGFATAFSCVASTPWRGGADPLNKRDHIEVAALKLIDFRRTAAQDLPVQEAIVFKASGISTGNRGFYDTCQLDGDGPSLYVLNGSGRFGNALNSPGEGQLVVLHSARGDPVSDNNGVPWENACPAGPFFEPWVAFNPFNKDNAGAIMGQWPDMVTVYQVYLDPQGAGTFTWDSQTWRPYTQKGTEAQENRTTGTVCLRVTDVFTP